MHGGQLLGSELQQLHGVPRLLVGRELHGRLLLEPELRELHHLERSRLLMGRDVHRG